MIPTLKIGCNYLILTKFSAVYFGAYDGMTFFNNKNTKVNIFREALQKNKSEVVNSSIGTLLLKPSLIGRIIESPISQETFLNTRKEELIGMIKK